MHRKTKSAGNLGQQQAQFVKISEIEIPFEKRILVKKRKIKERMKEHLYS